MSVLECSQINNLEAPSLAQIVMASVTEGTGKPAIRTRLKLAEN